MSFTTNAKAGGARPTHATDKPQAPRRLAQGERLGQGGETHGPWRVVSGVIRLDRRSSAGSVLVMLALPGDLLGAEALLGATQAFDAAALTPAVLAPVAAQTPAERQACLVEALLQQPQRNHDMARLRTGSVPSRLCELLRLLGATPLPSVLDLPTPDADAIRAGLPPLRDLAEVVDAKTETVCRALSQLLPPRSRRGGPRRWQEQASAAAARVGLGAGLHRQEVMA